MPLDKTSVIWTEIGIIRRFIPATKRKEKKRQRTNKIREEDTPLFRLTRPLAPDMQRRLESLQNQPLCINERFRIDQFSSFPSVISL